MVGGKMRNTLISWAMMLALAGTAASASVAPLTPEGKVMVAKRNALEAQARSGFADQGLLEKMHDWRKTWGYILVGKEGAREAPRLIVKDEFGWYEMRPGATRRLPVTVNHALNRLLTSAAVWTEQPFNWGAHCRGTPRLFVIKHAGKEQFGRLGCGREGLASQAARIAETLDAPAPAAAILPSRIDPPVPGLARTQHLNTSDIFERLTEMNYAWDRKTLAGFVEPYAEDAVVERPEATLRGRREVVEWARRMQDWDGPYSVEGSRRMHVMNMPNQVSETVRYTTHELRWTQDGQPVRQTFSTAWRNNAGLWQIVHERISPVKPVTEQDLRRR
jgi:ketosteroid isomerase-like protein